MEESKIVYKLLGNNKGVILTRNPQVTERNVNISFKNAPSNALAVLEFDSGREVYKPLLEGECSVALPPQSEGSMKVAVIINNGTVNPRKWICEQMQFCRTPKGEVIVSPNDFNLPQEFVDLKLENESLREDNKKLHKRLDELDTRLNNIMEGYDLV